jgi:hypothetical protein
VVEAHLGAIDLATLPEPGRRKVLRALREDLIPAVEVRFDDAPGTWARQSPHPDGERHRRPVTIRRDTLLA